MTRIMAGGVGVVLVLLGATAAAAVDGGPWPNVDVFLADGSVFHDVTVHRVAGDPGLRIVRSDGAERLVRAADVLSVRDAGGAELRETIAAGAAPVPPPRSVDPEIGTAPPLVRAAPLLERSESRYFNWMIGGGYAAVRNIGGGFPGHDMSFPATTTLYRRIGGTWFLSTTATTAVDLGRQHVYSWDGTDHRIQKWNDRMLGLAVGRYAEESLFVWEAGPAALRRLDYLKLGFRVQAGWWVTLGGSWTMSPAVQVMLKPGFEDANGGTATEIGFKLELLVR